MSAISCLECRANSHPFQQRTLYLIEPVKIGRSVARARPTENNAIFDCKVLSRNHALLWYENGKFFLKDTKSSNGTFVNNYRLSKGSEESSPQELFYGDIVQFGVDVVENSKKGTVTHGCIIATLKLYLPSGEEAKLSSPSICFGEGLYQVSSRELSQLYFSLQEAQQREKMIESKLSSFQEIVVSIQDAASKSWSAMIEEDRLLQHIELLENQLALYGKNCSEDSSKEEVRRVLEEKSKYETSVKESLQRLLEEKTESANKCTDLERSISLLKTKLNAEKNSCECVKNELENALNKLTAQSFEIQKLSDKIKSLEDQLKEHEDLQSWMHIFESHLGESDVNQLLAGKGGSPSRVVSVLIEENGAIKQHLSLVEAQLKKIQDKKLDDLQQALNESLGEVEETDLEKTFSVFRSALQSLQSELKQRQAEVLHTQSSIAGLATDTEFASKVEQKCQAKKAELQDELCDKKSKQESNAALVDFLKNQIQSMEWRLEEWSSETPKIPDDLSDNTVTLCRYKKNSPKASDDKPTDDVTSNVIDTNDTSHDKSHDSLRISTTINEDEMVVDKNALNGNKGRKIPRESVSLLRTDIEGLKGALELTEYLKSEDETELTQVQDKLSQVTAALLKSSHEATNLQQQLAANEAVLTEKRRVVDTLQGMDSQLDPAIDLILEHLRSFAQRMSEEKRKYSDLASVNSGLESKLKEAESMSRNNLQKLQILRDKLTSLGIDEKELNHMDNGTNPSVESNDTLSTIPITGTQEPLKLSSTTAFMGTKSLDNSVSSDASNLSSPSKRELVIPRNHDSSLDSTFRGFGDNTQDSTVLEHNIVNRNVGKSYLDKQEDATEFDTADSSSIFCVDTPDESSVPGLKLKLEKLRQEHNSLKEKLALANSEFADLALQNQMALALSVFPLFVLLIGVFTAFYDTLSAFTATTEF